MVRLGAWSVRSPVALRIGYYDAHRWAGWLALAGLAAGSAMAVFGLPPLDVHGFPHYVGIMGPFCGATRSVWAPMGGDLALSWRYNPLGIVLVAGAVAAILRLAVGAATRRWVNVAVLRWRFSAIVVGVVLGALTVRQQLRVDLLTAGSEFSLWGPLLNTAPVLVWLAVLMVQRRLMARRVRRGQAIPG